MAKKKSGGKKQKRTAASEAKTTAVKPSDVMAMPNTALIKRLANLKIGAAKQHDDINTSLNEELSPAVEKKGVDRWALNVATSLLSLSKKNKQKMATRLYHLLRYMDDLELEKLAEEQIEMFSRGQDAEEESEGEASETGEGDGTSAEERTESAARDVEEAAGERVH